MAKIGLIIGSIREKSQSDRIGQYVQNLVNENPNDTLCEYFSLKQLHLPLWSEDKWKPDSQMALEWTPVSTRLKSCDGFIFIVPEWAGMAPPHLKNFLLMCDKGELAHKPCQLIGISAGMGGAYPIAELRMSGYKNNFLMWLPDHMILRNVDTLFQEKEETDLDISLKKRLNYSLTLLVESALALKPVREKFQDLKSYKNGM